MDLTIGEITRIAALARLRLSPEDEAVLPVQMREIVAFVDRLARFETAEPKGEAEGEADGRVGTPPRTAVDEPAACLPRDRVLANAPATTDGFIVVPEVK